jgi:hypothetical protein
MAETIIEIPNFISPITKAQIEIRKRNESNN